MLVKRLLTRPFDEGPGDNGKDKSKNWSSLIEV